MLMELRRVLDACPAAKLGFILAGAELEQGYGYGDYSTYYPSREQRDLQQVS